MPRYSANLLLPQAAERNQTRSGQEDQQIAHTHCRAGEETLQFDTFLLIKDNKC